MRDADAMSSRFPGRFLSRGLAGVLLLAPILYVASIGPVLRLTSFGGESIRPVHDFYHPLFYACSRHWFPPIHSYLHWWKVELREFDDGSNWFIVNPATKSG